jgi:uncharacterized protein YyaL (SSP411 family)
MIERDQALVDRATAMLAALAPRLAELRDFGAEIARAALLLLKEPLHVTIVGPEDARPTTELVEEALRLPHSHRLVDLLDPEKDLEVLRRAGLDGDAAEALPAGEANGAARAYVCVGRSCSAPAATPNELRRAAGAG